MADWHIYTGVPGAISDIAQLPPPPKWRDFRGGPLVARPLPHLDQELDHQAVSYRPDPPAVEQINAALYLRRPLLVTGRPGTGKSTLAYAVARELGMGPVLYWPITSRSTLRDGLYQYDPLTRLAAASRTGDDDTEDIGRYIRLGPLGTALLPYEHPRVLLIDEIDKSDIDLPNDLLTVFEKGEYEVVELSRGGRGSSMVTSADNQQVPVADGIVQCRAFPLVIMTSNREREFPPAFLRRCIQLELREPDAAKLRQIIDAHMAELAGQSDDLIQLFLTRKGQGQLATDQLLHAVYLTNEAAKKGSVDRLSLAERIMPFLSGGPPDDL
ncbi:AAA family ATPase [Nonomuraea sp. K274]|uniref:AAA family ATPase n=1 Tax=Nonomuraea cypriaca TaxID=1187855 RepID=A0A931F0V1_9ACTN|nr:MoxR family ATPase [Nonomuraea cypriaca]MBF8191254.1 AAA family ATPase [Nonomuraea cypriaca]